MKTILKTFVFSLFFLLSTLALSAGPGSFQSFPTYPTSGISPITVALADFNHDGSQASVLRVIDDLRRGEYDPLFSPSSETRGKSLSAESTRLPARTICLISPPPTSD
jgi:hypothetical protein